MKTILKMTSGIQSKSTKMKTISRKLIHIALFLFIGFATQAQDKKAKELLDEVTAKVKSYDNIVIDFKYSLSFKAG